jgi:hypothetical protein
MTEAYAMRGTYTLSLGDLDGAIADYTPAIELDPNSGQYSKAARPLRKQREITREPRPITGAPRELQDSKE